MKPQLRKPLPTGKGSAVDVEAIINRGGSAPARETTLTEAPEPGRKPVMVHIATDVLSEIEHVRKARRVKTSRTAWIMEAIVEKLDRETKEQG